MRLYPRKYGAGGAVCEGAFSGYALCYAAGDLSAWIDVRAVPFSSEELQEALVHIGKVAIMKGETYGSNGKGYLRMNCGCPRAKLLEGLQRMKKAVDALYEERR